MSFTETTIYTKPADPNFDWQGEIFPWIGNLNDAVLSTALLKRYDADWDAYFSSDRAFYTNVLVFSSRESYDLFNAEPWVINKRSEMTEWADTFNVNVSVTTS